MFKMVMYIVYGKMHVVHMLHKGCNAILINNIFIYMRVCVCAITHADALDSI